jgi:outer membrane biogenesis lipoprotein LolB
MTKRTLLAAASLVTLLVGCSDMSQKPANNRDTMTQRQKDSVLGQSSLPGAQVVTKAMKMADSLDAIRKRQDSAMTKPDTGR